MPRPKNPRMIGAIQPELKPQELARCGVCGMQVPVTQLERHRRHLCPKVRVVP